MACKVTLVAFLCASLSLAAGESTASNPIQVTVAKPTHRDVTRWLKLPADVEPDAEITFYAEVSGFLTGLSVDIGDMVRPGQVIGHIFAPDLEQDVKLAEAQVGAAEADYQKALADLEQQEEYGREIDAEERISRAELEKDKAELGRVNDKFERLKKLVATSAATELDYINQKFLTEAAGAAVVSMEEKLDKYKTDRELWRKQVASSKAAAEVAKNRVAQAQAALNRAKTFFAFTELAIPEVGYHPGAPAFVTRRFVASGDLIRGGSGATSGVQPLVTLQVSDPVRVVADVPEADSLGLQKGSEARILFLDFKEPPALYKVSRTSHALTSNARTLRVEIDIPNAAQKYRPGMMTIIEFAAEVHKNVQAVPKECVVSERSDNHVFAIENGKAKKVAVQMGLRSDNWCEIVSPGFNPDTQLVKNIPESLIDGAEVQVKE
jgi:RND family efflux transporter MFP subunit